MEIRDIGDPFTVPEASTQYSHSFGFVGSSAAESMDPDTDLGHLVPLSPDLSAGQIVGFTLYKERDLGISARVYVVPHSQLEDTNLPDLAVANGGALRVVQVDLPSDVTIDQLIAQFTRFAVTASFCVDGEPIPLLVVARTEASE